MSLEECPYEQVQKVYNKYFSLGFIDYDIQKKFALISLICKITYEINKKRNFVQNMNCYQVLCNLGINSTDGMKNTVLKSLGAICDDLMYGCDSFPDFGIKVSEMPQIVRQILEKQIPF